MTLVISWVNLAALIIFSGFATDRQATGDAGPFEFAARSRAGACVDGMIVVWAPPASILNEQAEDGPEIAY